MNPVDLLSNNSPYRDKIFHAAAGLAVAVVAGMFVAPLWAFAAGVAAGVGKEVFDKVTGKGVPDVLDAVVTAVGAAVGAASHYFLD